MWEAIHLYGRRSLPFSKDIVHQGLKAVCLFGVVDPYHSARILYRNDVKVYINNVVDPYHSARILYRKIGFIDDAQGRRSLPFSKDIVRKGMKVYINNGRRSLPFSKDIVP